MLLAQQSPFLRFTVYSILDSSTPFEAAPCFFVVLEQARLLNFVFEFIVNFNACIFLLALVCSDFVSSINITPASPAARQFPATP
jgi:hypothetical protein